MLTKSQQKTCAIWVIEALGRYIEDKYLDQISPYFYSCIENGKNFRDSITIFESLRLNLPVPLDIFCFTLNHAFYRATKYNEAILADIHYYSLEGLAHGPNCKFCKNKIGKNYHINKIMEMDNHVLNPPILFGGGWDCCDIWEPNPF